MKRKSFAVIVVVLSILLSLFSGCGKPSNKRPVYDCDVKIHDNGLIGVDLTVFYPVKSKKTSEVLFNVSAKPKIVFDGVKAPFDGYTMQVTYLSIDDSICDFTTENENGATIKVDLKSKSKKDVVKIKLKYSVYCSGANDLSMFEGLNLGDFIAYIPNADCDKDYENVDYKKWLLSPMPFDAEVKITVPSTYAVAIASMAKSCDVSGDKTAYGYELFNVKSLSFSISQNYNVNCQKWGYKPVNYYFYNDISAFFTMELIKNCLSFCQNAFGKYQYDGFLLCQTNGKIPSVSTAAVFVPKSLSGKKYLYSIAFETARQWWGESVFPKDEFTDRTMQGLAYYACYSFFQSYKGYGIDTEQLRTELINYLSSKADRNERAVKTFTKLLLCDEKYGKEETLVKLKSLYLTYAGKCIEKNDLDNLSYLN